MRASTGTRRLLWAHGPALTRVSSYVESLKRRVADLDSGPAKRPRTTPADSTPDDAPADDSSVRDTMGAIGFLSNSAMAEPPMADDEGPTRHRFALTEVVLAALAIAGHDPSRSGAAQPSMVLEDYQVPLSRQSTLAHFTIFAEWTVHVPYLDRTLLIKHFEETTGSANRAHVPALHRFNTYMAIATGIMMSPDADRLSFLSASLHALAVKLLPLTVQPHSPLDSVHCITMLLFYSLVSAGGGSAWHLLGLAMKTCIALGLHKDAGPQAELGDADPRWLFWTLYIFDRSLSTVMDRPFSIQDADVSVQVPLDADGKALVSRHLVRHAQLASSIRDGSDDDDAMCAYHNICFWRDSAPASIKADAVDQLACRSLMQIHHPTGPGLLGDDVTSDAVEACQRLINRLYERYGAGDAAGSFMDAYDALSAAVVLTCLTKRLGRRGPQHLTQLLAAINKTSSVVAQVAGRFPAFRAFGELLFRLSARVTEEHGGRTEAFVNSLDSIPGAVPRRLRQLLRDSFPGPRPVVSDVDRRFQA